jgi:hypothetical protein
MPEHTPYCSDTKAIEELKAIIESTEKYTAERHTALNLLSRLFESTEVTV